MALTNLCLADQQSPIDNFVMILGDDGNIRVIAKICRGAIDDYWELQSSTPNQRVDLVCKNLDSIKKIILNKYDKNEYEQYERHGSIVREVILSLKDFRDAYVK
jgi:hypothetical protein